MDQNSGLNAMSLNAAIASLNTSGYGGFNSGQMTSMMSGLSNMASSMTNMNPMSMVGSDQYNPGQPYHQQTYQTQQVYQPQYAQPSQLQHYQPQQQQQQPQYQRAYQHQPALPMTTTLSSLESNTNGGSGDDRAGSNDYREFKEKTLDVCREFMRGFCNRNEDRCKFAHPPPFVDVKDGKVIVCFDFTKNRCRRTQPPCRYMHPPPHLCPDFGSTGGTPGARRSGSRGGDYGGSREGYTRRDSSGARGYDRGPMYDVSDPIDRYDGYSGSGSRRGGNGYGDSQWGPPPSRGGNRRDERRDSRSRSGSSWGYQGRYGDGPRSDQIEVCREYLRNNCDRQECRYAHPPAHVKVENGHVVYCIDHVVKGSCRKGDECRYFHMPRHLALRYGKIDPRGQKRTYDEMRDEERESDEHHHSPRDDDHQRNEQDSGLSEEKKNADEEQPLENSDPEATIPGEEVQEKHVEKSLDDHFDDHKVEDEAQESDGNPLGEEEVQSDDGVSGAVDCSNSAYPAGPQDAEKVEEEDHDAPNVAEEVEEVKDEEERCNEAENADEDRLVMEDVGVLAETEVSKTIEAEEDNKPTESEAYLEGPPQKRIALDADSVEEQQS